MQDLTQGSIPKHLVALAAPIAVGMLFQTLYFLVDLYFVAKLGDSAIAGVGAAGNVSFVVMALTQVLGVGTATLISHAAGRKDAADANLVFNQSLALAFVCALVTLVGGWLLVNPYMHTLGADAATQQAGEDYLRWYLPGLALQFAIIAMGSALRGTGITKPSMFVQMLTVLLNVVLAPVLIAGWGTGHPMGVAGAGLATSIAIGIGVILLGLYFVKLEKFVGFDSSLWMPRLTTWWRVLRIGLPSGGEFALMFVYMGVIYAVIRPFGAAAQAGFGIGGRVMQAIFLPAMAIAFAASPLAGQNVGANLHDRVRAAFRSAFVIGSSIMLVLTLLCQVKPEIFIGPFTNEPAVVAIASEFLRFISWNFVASGIVFTCSGLFQALGNTLPSLLSSGSRLITFVLPAFWLSTQPNFGLRQLWILSVASVALQAVLSLLLLSREFKRRLPRTAAAA